MVTFNLNHACRVKISADDILKYFSYFSQKIGFEHGDNLHAMSNPISGKKNKKNISVCRLLNILPSILSVKKSLSLFNPCPSE